MVLLGISSKIITITVMIIEHLGVGRNDKGDHGNYNKEQGGGDKVSVFNSIYYMANPFLGKSLCSDSGSFSVKIL